MTTYAIGEPVAAHATDHRADATVAWIRNDTAAALSLWRPLRFVLVATLLFPFVVFFVALAIALDFCFDIFRA